MGFAMSKHLPGVDDMPLFERDSHDPKVRELRLVRQFQRKIRREGISIESVAYREPLKLIGRITKLTEDEIQVRLLLPRYWRIRACTWVAWAYSGYRPFEVDLENQLVEPSKEALVKAEFLLKLSWIRARHFAIAKARTAECYS